MSQAGLDVGQPCHHKTPKKTTQIGTLGAIPRQPPRKTRRVIACMIQKQVTTVGGWQSLSHKLMRRVPCVMDHGSSRRVENNVCDFIFSVRGLRSCDHLIHVAAEIRTCRALGDLLSSILTSSKSCRVLFRASSKSCLQEQCSPWQPCHLLTLAVLPHSAEVTGASDGRNRFEMLARTDE